MTVRTLHAIARDIVEHWPKPYFGAVPYLEALIDLESITDDYGADSAQSIVLYFLSNATTWRGPDARRIKAELKVDRPRQWIPNQMTSWKPEVRVGRSETWSGNAIRTATQPEAEAYVRDLCVRWTATSDWRVVESDDPVTAVWKDGRLRFL